MARPMSMFYSRADLPAPIRSIALVPETGGVSAAELALVCAALQRQVSEDFAPIWGSSAVLTAFPSLEQVPVGYWPIVLSERELGSAAGIYLDEDGEPYAHIALSSAWTLDASRACLELLINPFGTQTIQGPSPFCSRADPRASTRSEQGVVDYLVEACGACADPSSAYTIHGVLVSDFCTPAFFGMDDGAGSSTSFHGSLSAPLTPLSGGHVIWFDESTRAWWLRDQRGAGPSDLKLGALEGFETARDLVRKRQLHATWNGRERADGLDERLQVGMQETWREAEARAVRLREQLEARTAFVAELSEEELLRAVEWGSDDEAEVHEDDLPTKLLPAPLPVQPEVASADVAAEVKARDIPSQVRLQSTPRVPRAPGVPPGSKHSSLAPVSNLVALEPERTGSSRIVVSLSAMAVAAAVLLAWAKGAFESEKSHSRQTTVAASPVPKDAQALSTLELGSASQATPVAASASSNGQPRGDAPGPKVESTGRECEPSAHAICPAGEQDTQVTRSAPAPRAARQHRRAKVESEKAEKSVAKFAQVPESESPEPSLEELIENRR